jgi:hypothetical protein
VVVLARRDGADWAITASNNGGAPRTLAITLPEGAPTAGWTDVLARTPATVDAARTLTLVVPPRFGVVVATKPRPTPSR